MARHLYLVQRHSGGENDGKSHCWSFSTAWRDCGIADCGYADYMEMDSYGNEGYPSLEEARWALRTLREEYPFHTYRLIQIVS